MNAKFSVLLPTKNRLELLQHAVETVRRQSYADWEIVISDNASEDDIAGYVGGLGEPRVKYVRSAEPIPVTANWNLALQHSSGEYVIMLGDDDGLLKGHLESAAKWIEKFANPDLVLTDALLFAYPGVMPGRKSGFLQVGYGVFFDGRREPYLLERDAALKAVRSALDFRVACQFNMQYSIVSRRLIDEALRRGPYFQSPYPDFYASNSNLLLAERVLVVPKPMVCIGITPRSFGYYYFNRQQEEGARFLDNLGETDAWKSVRRYLMPGNDLFTCWLVAIETVRANFAGAAPGREPLKVGYRRYRFVQLWWAARFLGRVDLLRVLKQGKWWELLLFLPVVSLLVAARLAPKLGFLQAIGRKLDRWISPFPDRDTRIKEIPARDMLEVFNSVEPEYY